MANGQPNTLDFFEPAYEIYYQLYMQELISGDLSLFWGRIDTVTTIAVALTAPASTITGLAMWNQPAGKLAWGLISGFASLVSFLSAALLVPGKVKQQSDFRNSFLQVRLEAEALLQDLKRPALPYDEANKRFTDLRVHYQAEMEKTKPDVILTSGWLNKIQTRLDEIMRRKGYLR